MMPAKQPTGMGVEKPRVPFLCTHNAARSQMAEALLGPSSRASQADRQADFTVRAPPERSCRPLRDRLLGRQCQCLSQCLHALGHEPVEHPRASALPRQKPRLGKHLQVVANRGLCEAERLDEVADARLRARLARDVAQQPEPSWVRNRLEGRRERLGVIPSEARPQQGSTAADHPLFHRHGWILT